MADNEQKALAMVKEAEKKIKSSSSFFGSLFGGQAKQEDAAELYVRAANLYKMSKKWPAAGEAFCQSAALQLQLGSRHEAASNYVDAGNCYRKSDPKEAVQCLIKAVEIYTDMGRFTIAAKNHITIAEIYETDEVDIDKAISNYEQAADYYKGEESNSSANKCLLKVAQYSAQLENYEKAVEIYEQAAFSAMDSSLLKYSAKDYFFKAALCHLCVDLLNAQQAVEKYEQGCPAFSDSRECKLLKKLMSALEEEDSDSFTEAVSDYDSISRLDQWTTSILLKVKKSISDLR